MASIRGGRRGRMPDSSIAVSSAHGTAVALGGLGILAAAMAEGMERSRGVPRSRNAKRANLPPLWAPYRGDACYHLRSWRLLSWPFPRSLRAEAEAEGYTIAAASRGGLLVRSSSSTPRPCCCQYRTPPSVTPMSRRNQTGEPSRDKHSSPHRSEQ